MVAGRARIWKECDLYERGMENYKMNCNNHTTMKLKELIWIDNSIKSLLLCFDLEKAFFYKYRGFGL